MLHGKDKHYLIAASAGAAIWVCGWMFGWMSGTAGGFARELVLGIAFLSSFGVLGLWAFRTSRDSATARKHFDALSRLSPSELASEHLQAQLPPIAAGSPWFAIASVVRESVRTQTVKLQQAEQARAALEIRSRRSAGRQQQIEAILSSLNEPVLAVDQYDELVLANPSAERLFGLPAADAGKRAIAQLNRCEQLMELLGEARRRKGAGARNGEVEIADSDGQARWYSVTAKALYLADGGDKGGAAPGAVAVLRDISTLKASQKKNAEFVSAASHEMKTPLAGIKAYVELLADGDAEDTQTREEFLGVIDTQATRLQRLIDNLLNLARIEAGVVEVSKQSRSLNELLEETLGIVRPSAEAKQITLISDLSGMYLGVLADRDMMMQAAINLLSNAIKYTRDGGRVTLRSRLVDNQVQFEVEDTGVGLSEEDAERVFEKFYRVKKDRDMAAGTGLGLPLAKHIVEDVHGGQLTVRSVLGQGSTFTVTLPSAGQMS